MRPDSDFPYVLATKYWTKRTDNRKLFNFWLEETDINEIVYIKMPEMSIKQNPLTGEDKHE